MEFRVLLNWIAGEERNLSVFCSAEDPSRKLEGEQKAPDLRKSPQKKFPPGFAGGEWGVMDHKLIDKKSSFGYLRVAYSP